MPKCPDCLHDDVSILYGLNGTERGSYCNCHDCGYVWTMHQQSRIEELERQAESYRQCHEEFLKSMAEYDNEIESLERQVGEAREIMQNPPHHTWRTGEYLRREERMKRWLTDTEPKEG